MAFEETAVDASGRDAVIAQLMDNGCTGGGIPVQGEADKKQEPPRGLSSGACASGGFAVDRHGHFDDHVIIAAPP